MKRVENCMQITVNLAGEIAFGLSVWSPFLKFLANASRVSIDFYSVENCSFGCSYFNSLTLKSRTPSESKHFSFVGLSRVTEEDDAHPRWRPLHVRKKNARGGCARYTHVLSTHRVLCRTIRSSQSRLIETFILSRNGIGLLSSKEKKKNRIQLLACVST